MLRGQNPTAGRSTGSRSLSRRRPRDRPVHRLDWACSACRSAWSALGGAYVIESESGRGTLRSHHDPAAAKYRRRARRRVVTSVLIIDDHPIVLQGCRRILEDAHVDTVLEARDAVSGYRSYCRHKPDVVVIDLAMQGKGLGGLELIRRIKSQNARARILVFSMHSDPTIVARALKAGATGYVIKDTSSEEFVEAFEKVRAGTPHLSNELAMQVALIGTGSGGNPLRD